MKLVTTLERFWDLVQEQERRRRAYRLLSNLHPYIPQATDRKYALEALAVLRGETKEKGLDS